MSVVDLCKEFEEVRNQVRRIIAEAVNRFGEARDRIAKIVAIDMNLIRGEEDRYGALATYIDLVNLISALMHGEMIIDIDITRVLDNLGCRKEENKVGENR